MARIPFIQKTIKEIDRIKRPYWLPLDFHNFFKYIDKTHLLYCMYRLYFCFEVSTFSSPFWTSPHSGLFQLRLHSTKRPKYLLKSTLAALPTFGQRVGDKCPTWAARRGVAAADPRNKKPRPYPLRNVLVFHQLGLCRNELTPPSASVLPMTYVLDWTLLNGPSWLFWS